MSALLSFLGGSAFRAIWGELSSAWTKYQDHKHELEMARLQEELDQKRHERVMQLQAQAAQLNIQTIQAKGDVDATLKDIDAFISANRAATAKTGYKWLDIFRQAVQPLLAYIAIMLWVSALHSQGYNLTDWDKELISAIFGMYLANRHLSYRGK